MSIGTELNHKLLPRSNISQEKFFFVVLITLKYSSGIHLNFVLTVNDGNDGDSLKIYPKICWNISKRYQS